MENTTYVDKNTCELLRKNTEQKLDMANEKIEGHDSSTVEQSKQIMELTRISDKLTQLLERALDDIKCLEGKVTILERRVDWWDTEVGKFLVKAAVVMIFLLLASAIGKGFLDNVSKLPTL